MSAEIPDSLRAEVETVLQLMGDDAAHLDDPLTATRESGLSTEIFGKIAFPIFRQMLVDAELLWSVERITRVGVDLVEADVDPDLYTNVVGNLVVELEEHGLLEPRGESDSDEVLLNFKRDSEEAYKYLVDLAQIGGFDKKVVDQCRRALNDFRRWY